MPQRNELHLCDFANGHMLSTDCWCEPTTINYVQNRYGVWILVVEHVDYTAKHRLSITAEREAMLLAEQSSEESRRILYVNHSEAPWITRVLNLPSPPSDPNERTL